MIGSCNTPGIPYGATMIEEHDFADAMENTRVVLPPKALIETFGTTSFKFLLVSELMDEVNAVRVRGGAIEAERPRIVSPHNFKKLMLEGFGENARGFAEWVEEHGDAMRVLKYGFQFRKTDLRQSVVHDPIDEVIGRLRDGLHEDGDRQTALISGVDEGWEVCLVKFTMDLIQRSAGENIGEWKRRGLI